MIMFMITVAFVTLFFVPATAYKQKNELIGFYWVGTWVFLAVIAAFSGSAETLSLMSYDANRVSDAVLASLVVCFTLFVAFGWFRLSFKAISIGIRHLLRKKS